MRPKNTTKAALERYLKITEEIRKIKHDILKFEETPTEMPDELDRLNPPLTEDELKDLEKRNK